MLTARSLSKLRKFKCRRLLHSQRPAELDSRWPGWEIVVGLEVHAQIKARRKLFSNAPTPNSGDPPNVHVSAYDASFPGTLPRINPKCVELALRTALALNSDIQLRSSFDRKHYFYPDLPLGYQITQHYKPLALGGTLTLPKKGVAIRIKQVQLEQDTAKSILDTREHVSLIDLNRAGAGLMEIVSEPDIRTPQEAGEYVRTLQAILRSIGASDCNMEEGSLRCDVNVSVNKVHEPPGTRCEVKNLNSIKSVVLAIAAEVDRQTATLTRGMPVHQETRGFDEHKAQTFKLRSKEDTTDYRYLPDPNLPPLLLTSEYISRIRDAMPLLPQAIRARLMSQGLSETQVDTLMSIDAGDHVPFDGELQTQGAVPYFDRLAHGRDLKVAINWMTNVLLGRLSACGLRFQDNPVSAEQLGELLDLVNSRKITGSSAKLILRRMIETPSGETVTQLSSEYVTSTSIDLHAICEEIVRDFPKEAMQVREAAGEVPVINKLIGIALKRTKGQADANATKRMLISIIVGEKTSENL